jgi:hypothetical protein
MASRMVDGSAGLICGRADGIAEREAARRVVVGEALGRHVKGRNGCKVRLRRGCGEYNLIIFNYSSLQCTIEVALISGCTDPGMLASKHITHHLL